SVSFKVEAMVPSAPRPINFSGENVALRAAEIATLRSRGSPSITFTAVTLPFLFTVTRTVTVPETCSLFAVTGYSGLGTFTCFPLHSPQTHGKSLSPDTGADD